MTDPRSDEDGAVTAEIAVAMPALVIVMLLCLWGIVAGATLLRCSDAARMGARAVARGDSEEQVRAVIASSAPGGASVRVTRDASSVSVVVRSVVPRPAALRLIIPALSVRGAATAPSEGSG